jgi:hypothetical protein
MYNFFLGVRRGRGGWILTFFGHEKCYFNILKKFMGKMTF